MKHTYTCMDWLKRFQRKNGGSMHATGSEDQGQAARVIRYQSVFTVPHMVHLIKGQQRQAAQRG